MPIVEVNENECVFVRNGVICRGSIDSHVVTSHSIHANPAMTRPLVTLSVAVSSMVATTAVERAQEHATVQRRMEDSSSAGLLSRAEDNRRLGLVGLGDDMRGMNRISGQSTLQSSLSHNRVSVLPQGWAVQQESSVAQRLAMARQLEQLQDRLSSAMSGYIGEPITEATVAGVSSVMNDEMRRWQAQLAGPEAGRPVSVEVSLQPTQDISAAVNDMLAEVNENAMAGLRDVLPLPEANSAVPETVSGLTDFRVGALGRSWLVSHFLTTSIPISAATTSRDVINILNENVQQVLEQGADLFPYPHERFLRVMGYSRRQDFPPIEIASQHVGAIYFARDTNRLYWLATTPAEAGDFGPVYVQFDQTRPLDATQASSSTVPAIPAEDIRAATVPALPAEDIRAAERTGAIQNTGVQRGRLRVTLVDPERNNLRGITPDQSRLYIFEGQPVAFVWRDAAYRPTNISVAYVNNYFGHNEMFNGGDRDGFRGPGENWFAYYKTGSGGRATTATVNVLDAPVYVRFDCLYADEAWRDIAPIHPPIEEVRLLESLGFPARNIAQDNWNDPPAASLRPVRTQAPPHRRGDFLVTFCDSLTDELACDFRLYVVRGWEMAVVFRGNAFRATNISNAYLLNFYRNGDYLTTRPSDPGTRPARYNPGAPVTPGVSDMSTVLELESQYVYIPADWLLSDVTTGWRRFQPLFRAPPGTRQAGIAMINTWGTAVAPNLNTINTWANTNVNPNLAAATQLPSSGSFPGGRPPSPPAPQHTPVPISIDKPRRLMLQD